MHGSGMEDAIKEDARRTFAMADEDAFPEDVKMMKLK